MMQGISRRAIARSVVGMGIGGFAARPVFGLHAQEATPVVAVQPVGYLSLRVRQLADAAYRPEINEIVTSEFVPTVQALDGYAGYLLGDVVEDASQSLSIVILDEPQQAAGFDAAAAEFVGGLDPKYAVETPVAAQGDLLVAGTPVVSDATPAATPVVAGSSLAGGYVAVRIFTGIPGTDPRDLAPRAISGFLPIAQALPGFQGYFFLPTEGGFMSISLFESEEAAQESNVAGAAFAAENGEGYTDGNPPQVINAMTVFADLPILAPGE